MKKVSTVWLQSQEGCYGHQHKMEWRSWIWTSI